MRPASNDDKGEKSMSNQTKTPCERDLLASTEENVALNNDEEREEGGADQDNDAA
jgi:hypothetical protein